VRVAELKQAAWDLLRADDHQGALQEVQHLIYCCFSWTASLLLYCFFTASLLQGALQEVEHLQHQLTAAFPGLLLYCFFTASLLLLYCKAHVKR